MNKLISFLYSNTDKLIHFIIGILIYMISFYFTKNYYYSFYFVCVIAFIKEFYDLFVKKTLFNYKDFAATVLGALLVTVYNYFVL